MGAAGFEDNGNNSHSAKDSESFIAVLRTFSGRCGRCCRSGCVHGQSVWVSRGLDSRFQVVGVDWDMVEVWSWKKKEKAVPSQDWLHRTDSTRPATVERQPTQWDDWVAQHEHSCCVSLFVWFCKCEWVCVCVCMRESVCNQELWWQAWSLVAGQKAAARAGSLCR